jgi:hypothetical protein
LSLDSLTFFRRSAWTGQTQHGASPFIEDWSSLMLRSRTTLISGGREATEAFILAAIPAFRRPVRRYACDANGPLPRPDGTLIFDDVETLDPDQQEQLLHWLDAAQAAETQMLAVTTASLYTRVQAGLFLSRLYYRLNALYVEVGA